MSEIVAGTLEDYSIAVGDGPWCVLHVKLGDLLAGSVGLSSRAARELAFDILAEQAPHLGYQPQNKNMREVPAVQSFGSMVATRREPRYKVRQRIQSCTIAVAKLIDEYGEDAFGWALNRKADR